LHLPPGTKNLFAERLKDIPEDRRISWRFHVVRPGETLDGIASSLHAKVADVASTNGITAADPMSPGDELVVPVASVTTAAAPQRYTVRHGDTLVTVADRFNVSVEQLRKWNNNLVAKSVVPGRSLYVAEPVHLGPATRIRARTRSTGKQSSTHGKTASSGAASSTKSSGAASSKASTHTTTKTAVAKPKKKDD
jgi:membrane-bound lytic murein transglycosylase D